MQQSEWLSVKQAAAVAGLSETTIRRAVRSGTLKAFNPTGSARRPTWRIRREDLVAFMEQNRAEGQAPSPPVLLRRRVKSRYFGEM
jgi:excisionase family DNA binding protein